MSLSDIGIVTAICSTLITGGGTVGGYYLKNEFVSVSSLEEAFEARDKKEIKRQIRSYEYDRDHGGLTDKEEWELDQLYDELEELE